MWFKEKKKAVALAVLILGLVFYWVYAYLNSGSSGKAVVQVPAKNAATPTKLTAITVNVDLLKRAVEPYRTAKNIFSPVYTKPVLEKPSSQTKKPGDVPVTVTPLPPLPPPPPPKSQEEIDADNAREEMQKVKVLGFVKRKQRTDVFLSLGKSNYIVGKGDVITKDYYLDDIAKDSVVVSDRKTGIQVKVPADFSGKNAKSMLLPGMGRAGSSSYGSPQPNSGTGGAMPGPGRSPGQRAPIYGSGGLQPTQNTGTNTSGAQQGLGNPTAPLGGNSI